MNSDVTAIHFYKETIKMQKINEAFELFDQGEYEQAEQVYLDCLSELKDRHSDSYKAVLNGLGYVKSHQGKFREAKQYFNELLNLSLEQADKKEEAMALHQLGMVERMAGEFEKALHFFTEEERVWSQHFSDFSVGFSANFYERGYIALMQERYEEAAELFWSSLDYAKAGNSLIAEGCAHRGMGEMEMAKNKVEQAGNHFQQALSAFEKAGDEMAAAEMQEFLNQL